MIVFKEFKFRMSNKKMADVMYAIISTRTKLMNTFGIGVKTCTRSQNSYNNVDAIIAIEEDDIQKFEEISGITLNKPQTIKVN